MTRSPTNLPLSIARKLLLLSSGERLQQSSFNPHWLKLLEQEGVLTRIRSGRTRAHVALASPGGLADFLLNRFSIPDLHEYVEALSMRTSLSPANELSGQKAHDVAGNTKLRTARTFKGFLVNVIEPVEALLNGLPVTLFPRAGSFIFIYDFENFRLPANVTVVGIENPENFRYVDRHGDLFSATSVFVCRYPYSSDLRTWLQNIPNKYIHFGDLDLAGIAIFEHEYKPLLTDRAHFFIPDNIDELLSKKGNRDLYNQQYQQYKDLQSATPEIQELIVKIHKCKKGLEQEGLLRG